MKRAVGLCCAALTAVLSACAGTTPPASTPPLSVDHGAGSQYGNYAAQAAGEMRGAEGERCIVFDWDRPLTKDLALRYKSASCESKDRPGRMVAREISRAVIPLSDSNVRDEESPPKP